MYEEDVENLYLKILNNDKIGIDQPLNSDILHDVLCHEIANTFGDKIHLDLKTKKQLSIDQEKIKQVTLEVMKKILIKRANNE